MVVRPAGAGRTSKGRQRIEIRRIECKERRQVTFSKRRQGLFGKASELAALTGARIAIVVFSEGGRAFAFGSPSVDAVLRGDGDGDGGCDGSAEDLAARQQLRLAAEEASGQVAAEKARMDDVGKKVLHAAAGRRFWWEADVGLLGEAELPEFTRSLRCLRDSVQRLADKVGAVVAP